MLVGKYRGTVCFVDSVKIYEDISKSSLLLLIWKVFGRLN